jgi:SSS family transporter
VGGGFLAVVWSDVFQGTLMFVGLVALPLIGLATLGSWGAMSDKLMAIDPSLLSLAGPGGWTGLTLMGTLGLALIGLGFLGSPQIFVRFIALRDEREIPKGAWVAFIWTLLADGGAVLTGMVGRALLTGPGDELVPALGEGGQDVLPLMVESLLPAMLVGLFIAIVLSAIMSTVDSLLVVASSAAVRDLYQQVFHPEMKDEQLMGLSRRATLVLSMVALGISMAVATLVEGRTVFWFVIFGWSGIAATFCPTMILSLYWKGMTARGALGAMIAGFVGVPLFKFGATALPGAGPYFAELAELPPAFALSFAAGVVLSLTDKEGRARLAAAGVDAEVDEAAR